MFLPHGEDQTICTTFADNFHRGASWAVNSLGSNYGTYNDPLPDDFNLSTFPTLRNFSSPPGNYEVVVVHRPVVKREDTARHYANVLAYQQSGFANKGLVKCSVPPPVTLVPSAPTHFRPTDVYYSGEQKFLRAPTTPVPVLHL